MQTEAIAQLVHYLDRLAQSTGRGEIHAVSSPAETRYKKYKVWTYTYYIIYKDPLTGRPAAAPSRTFRSWSSGAAQRGVQSLEPQVILPPWPVYLLAGSIKEETAKLILQQLGVSADDLGGERK